MRANIPYGSLANCWSIGKANVAVLPLPVSAFAIVKFIFYLNDFIQ
jgi:hypothetical protein